MHYFPRLFLLVCLIFAASVAQAQTCSSTCTFSSVVNDYWPGTGNPAVGASSITVGARRDGGAGNTIASGDLLLVIQMQDAVVNTSNSTNYGSNSGSGSGYTGARQSGRHEFVYASNTVGALGGTINLSTPLTIAYNTTAVAASQTTPTFQVIRVPNCVSATLTAAVTAPAWSTSTGGVVAINAVNLNLNGQTIDANAIGFRGGATDRHNANNNTNNYNGNGTSDQFKGEGIAGAPRFLYSRATLTEINTGLDFPNGNRARGAPANGGGGGEGDSGGGGGGNGGIGGVGGVWSAGTGADGGGVGGSVFTERAFDRIVLGGGGGGGSAGPNGNSAADEAAPPWGNGGNGFSRGGAGGGIVILRASNRSGSLTINANGESAPFTPYAPTNTGIQVGGAGGAGGSVVLYGSGGSITVNANGGDGGTAQRATHISHGGGGGGGVVFSTTATGVSASTTGGRAGCTVAGTNDSAAAGCNTGPNLFTSTAGAAGPALQTFSSSPPGNPLCSANLSIAKDNSATSIAAGQTTTYTITVRNQGPSAADGTILRDPAATGLSCTSVSCSSSIPAGNCPGTGVNIVNLQGSGITLNSVPANSTLQFSVTCGVTATGQ